MCEPLFPSLIVRPGRPFPMMRNRNMSEKKKEIMINSSNRERKSKELTAGWNTLIDSTAGCPICRHPNTKSIHRCKFNRVTFDSSACRCTKINNRDESRAHGGKCTLSTRSPDCRTPKLKRSAFSRNSLNEKNSGINSFTSVVESRLANRHVVSTEWNVRSGKSKLLS